MTVIAIAALMLTSVAGWAARAQPAERADITGWHGAVWGQKPTEVSEATGFPLVKVVFKDAKEFDCYDAKGVSLGESTADVRFCFEPVGLNLIEVSQGNYALSARAR
jgi:hypothetical protein